MSVNNFVVELWLHSLSILSKLICARLHKPWLLAVGYWLLANKTKTITDYRLPFTEDEDCHSEGTVVRADALEYSCINN